MLTEDQKAYMERLAIAYEGFASMAWRGDKGKEIPEPELHALQMEVASKASVLRNFQGGPWFSVYWDMKEEGNMFVRDTKLALGHIEFNSDNIDSAFRQLVEGNELPIEPDMNAILRKLDRRSKE